VDPRRARGRSALSLGTRSAEIFVQANQPVSPALKRLLNTALFGIAIVLPLVWAVENIAFYNSPGNLVDPFTDANTYLAAGERLNAGHLLYQLQAGDRFVLTIPGIFDSPLLSPPPIAVVWRPIAATGIGFPLWVVSCWFALLGTIVFLLRRIGPWAALVVIALSFSLGEQLAVANMNSFAPAIFILAWRFQHRAMAGILLGSLTVVKLAPSAMVGWFTGTRRWMALLGFALTIASWLTVGAIGAGVASYVQYLGTVSEVSATHWSIAGLFGSAATYLFLAAGFAVAVVLGRRGRTRASFVAAVATSVLGTPALYASGLVGLLGALAPWAFRSTELPARASVSIAASPPRSSRSDGRPL
jgi:hypothetical protein